MSERTKLGLLCFLLLLALGIALFMIANAFQAMHNLQQQSNAAKAGDVSTIRPWMTVHVISRVYHVPEDYLDQSLNIAKTDPLYHATLYEIAAHKHQPVEKVIHMLQQAILTYRKEHASSAAPIQQLEYRHMYSAPAPGGTII